MNEEELLSAIKVAAEEMATSEYKISDKISCGAEISKRITICNIELYLEVYVFWEKHYHGEFVAITDCGKRYFGKFE